MGLNLEERKSTASITASLDEPDVEVGTWLQDETEPGEGIVWRVKTVDAQYNTRTRTIQAEHVINTLRDELMFGTVKPKDITGNPRATTCTAREAVEYILDQQEEAIWQLGDFDYDEVENPYNFNGENLLAALETVTGSLEDACWEFDLSSLPFTLSIVQLPEEEACEMRMSRNIVTMKRTVDRSRMYTRFYAIGKNDIHLVGDYISENEEIYGIISKVETDQSQETVEELTAWAEGRLKRHCEPSVTVTISGLELSESTGESLDHFRINTRCRVPLPEFGTTIVEKVTKLSWPDKIREKERVNVTLANLREDVASIINSQNAAGGRGGRAAAKKEGEDHAWFIDTDEHVGMVAEAIIGRYGQGVDWSRVSSIIVDGEGIHQRVVAAEGEIVMQQAQIDINETRILQEVTDRSQADATLSGQITIEAGKISQIVSAVGANGEVTAASIVLAINQSEGTSEAKIDADHVYIGNSKSTTVIAGKLEASDLTASLITSIISQAALVTARALSVTGGAEVGGDVYARGFYFGSGEGGAVSVANAFNRAQITSSGNTYTLQLARFGQDWETIGSFSRATTLGQTIGSSQIVVTASPQGNSVTFGIMGGNPGITWSGNVASVPVKVNINGGETVYDTGRRISVDATAIYQAGETAGYISGYDDNDTAQVDKSSQTLGYGQSVTVNAQYYDYDGNLHNSGSSCTITAPADRYITGYNANTTATLDSTSAITLGYGDSVTVYARQANYDGQYFNTGPSRTITAPADRYGAGYSAGYGDASDEWTAFTLHYNASGEYFWTGDKWGNMNARFEGSDIPDVGIACYSLYEGMSAEGTNAGNIRLSRITGDYGYVVFKIRAGGKYKTFYSRVVS